MAIEADPSCDTVRGYPSFHDNGIGIHLPEYALAIEVDDVFRWQEGFHQDLPLPIVDYIHFREQQV